MSRAQKDLSKEKEATLYEMFDYLCSKIDFGNSFLDATAVRSMDILSRKLREENKKYKL